MLLGMRASEKMLSIDFVNNNNNGIREMKMMNPDHEFDLCKFWCWWELRDKKKKSEGGAESKC